MTECILKAHNYAEYELCCWCFSMNFPNIFRAAILKENFLMDFPYFIKEHLQISASDEASLKKKKTFGSRPSSKLTLKTKWDHSCACCDDSRSCEQMKKPVTGKYFEKKKLDLNPNQLLLQEMYVAITILEWLAMYIHGIYVWQKFRRKNISNLVIIWIKFKVLWLLYVLFSTLAWCFRPRLSPDAQNRAFAKNGCWIQTLDMTLTCFLAITQEILFFKLFVKYQIFF